MTARDTLRDRIAQALHHEGAYCGNCGYENDIEDCPDCELILYGYARAIERLLADADPTDLGLDPIGGVAYCVMHDEMDIEGYDPMGECRRSDGCVEVPVYADHRSSGQGGVDG